MISWARNNLKLPKIEEFNNELSKLNPGQHGISVLPFLLGERALGWSANSKGTLSGLKYSNTSLEILQAILESISYRFLLVYRMLENFTDTNPEIIASGGAIKNLPWWIQTTADVLGKEINISKDNQDTGRGVAIMILKALGKIRNFDNIETEIVEKFYPNQVNNKIHQELINSHLNLYEKMIGT
jgi:gluconokinase